MRQKSDASKLRENRCVEKGRNYVPWIRTNEAKSIATASLIPDPSGRSVSTLSGGERDFFLIMRRREDVREIEEQRVLDAEIVRRICERNGFRKPSFRVSTDFLVTFEDGSRIAYSVKGSRNVFRPDHEDYRAHPERHRRLLERQIMEQEYWRELGVGFEIVFGDELDRAYAANIATVMAFSRVEDVDETDAEDLLKHLVARRLFPLDMRGRIVRFAEEARKREDEIRKTWEEHKND